MKFFCLVMLYLWCMGLVHGQAEDFKHLSWHKADSLVMLYPNHSLNNLNELVYKLTNSLKTDAEKFRAIYRWTCENIYYDHNLFLKNQKVRSKTSDPDALQDWNKKGNELMYEGLLNRHRTICTGYAYLIRELALRAGIKCVIVDGYGRSSSVNVGGKGIPNHQWNAVQLNNKWYLCDATWSAGSVMVPSGLYVKDYRNEYFLCNPQEFIRNHYPIDSTWLLGSQKPKLSQFLNGPLIYYPFFEMGTTKLLPETFEINATKKETVKIQFNSRKDSLGVVTLQINNRSITVSNSLKPDDNGLYVIEHTFSNKGLYLIHVNHDNKNLFSYKVKVH